MKRYYSIFTLLLITGLLSVSCSSDESAGSTDPAHVSEAKAAQTATPTPVPVVQTIPSPTPKSVGQAPPMPSPLGTATATKSSPDGGSKPVLLVPVKRIDFGGQKKDSTIQRVIQIRNIGNAELKIQSVSPS